MKYYNIKLSDVNREIELFKASEIIAEDRLLKGVFVANETNNNALISCYIKSNNTYNLIPANSLLMAADRMTIIQKGLIFNDNDIVCIKSNIANIDFSIDIVYDNEVN